MSYNKSDNSLSLRTVVAIGLAVVGLIVLAYSGWSSQTTSQTVPTTSDKASANSTSKQSIGQPKFNAPKTALIVDQLSKYYPNPTLIQTATQQLEAAGYAVTYLPTEEVTVDFYRSLPKRADDFIILRVHGTAVTRAKDGSLMETGFTSLATGEPEAMKYVDELKKRWLGRFVPDNTEEPNTFTVMEGFLKNAMQGRFDNSTILLIGCDGMRGEAGTAKLFIERGAKAVVGWTDNVSVEHMDKAIEELVALHIVDGKDINLATHQAHQTVGADPFFKAELRAIVVQ